MIVRYIPAAPAGNLTAIVLSPVAPQARAAGPVILPMFAKPRNSAPYACMWLF